MRIKVSWQETCLVIPLKSYDFPPKIEALLRDISDRFRKHTTHLDDDNYFVELRTDDGYLFDKNDLVTDVIIHGEKLQVIDYKNWFKKFKEETKLDRWMEVARSDFVDDTPKWVHVGHASKGNQIYIEFGTGLYNERMTKKFRVLDADALALLQAPSKKLIDAIEGSQGEDNWYASAHLITDTKGNRSVKISVKSMSDPRPQIELAEFTEGGDKKFAIRGTAVLQEAFFPPPTKAYKVPHQIAEGPTLKEDGDPPPVDLAKTTIKPGITLQQTGKVFAEQSFSYHGAWQCFSTEFRLTNTSSHPFSLIQVESEVQVVGGEWRPALTFSGHKKSEYYYDIRGEHDAILAVEACSVNKLSLQAKLTLDYTKYRSLSGGPRRIHPSLPNPCNIRYTIKDIHDQTAQIVVQAFNHGEFINRKTYEMDKKVSLYHWIQCDDVNSDERMYLPIEHKPGWTNKNVLEVWILPASKRPYIDSDTLRKWAWLASKQQNDYEIKDWNWEDESCSFQIKFYALFDREEQNVYGMKVFMKTTSSSVIDGFLFPKDIY